MILQISQFSFCCYKTAYQCSSLITSFFKVHHPFKPKQIEINGFNGHCMSHFPKCTSIGDTNWLSGNRNHITETGREFSRRTRKSRPICVVLCSLHSPNATTLCSTEGLSIILGRKPYK